MRLFIIALLGCLCFSNCREAYLPPEISGAGNYLVVEGLINSGTGPTTIRLSRTIRLNDSIDNLLEWNAIVTVESDQNTFTQLQEQGQGVYSINQLNLDPSRLYRLNIRTSEGKNYQSAFVPVKNTPEVDSISWERTVDGLLVDVSTQDPTQSTRYYRWDFDETWQYNSAFFSEFEYINNVIVDRDQSVNISNCYSFGNSTNLAIGSSIKLENDIIFRQPILFIPDNSIKLSVRYSILVKQYALTKEGYEYFELMKKLTEQMGGIFDPQPSGIRGNITCLDDPDEPVIGFVSVSNAKEIRKFISRSQLPSWNYRDPCYETFVPGDSLSFFFRPLGNLEPLREGVREEDGKTGYMGAPLPCVDCRERGGTNVRPVFW